MKILDYIILSSLLLSCTNMPHQVAERKRKALGIKAGGDSDIHAVVQGQRHEISKCRNQSYKKNKKRPRGKVQLVWLIQSSGRSTDVKINFDNLKDKSTTANCLVKFVQKTKFIPTPLSRMSKVTYVFTF